MAPVPHEAKFVIKYKAQYELNSSQCIKKIQISIYVPGLTPADEFTYEIVYNDDDIKTNLEPAVALKLIRQQRDRATGLVILVFDIIYAPYKTMK
jgi:hypothetical protein